MGNAATKKEDRFFCARLAGISVSCCVDGKTGEKFNKLKASKKPGRGSKGSEDGRMDALNGGRTAFGKECVVARRDRSKRVASNKCLTNNVCERNKNCEKSNSGDRRRKGPEMGRRVRNMKRCDQLWFLRSVRQPAAWSIKNQHRRPRTWWIGD